MHSRHASTTKVLEGMVARMTPTRAERAKALERWADDVDAADLVEIDADELRAIARCVARREQVERALDAAVAAARRNGRSWSEIGTMLGVSKQAAQRKYSRRAS